MGRLLLISPDELHSHEAVDENASRRVRDKMSESGQFHPPLLLDLKTKVVLDGHHRLWASKRLGCFKIPCYCVDYIEDESIVLEAWREGMELTKQQVIDMGLSDEVFPLKTTRHVYRMPDSIKPIPLDELLDGK